MLTGILILIEIDQVSPSNPLVCWQLQRVVVGVRLFQGDHFRVQTQHTDSLKIEHRGGDTLLHSMVQPKQRHPQRQGDATILISKS